MNIIVCGENDSLKFSKTLCRLLFRYGGASLLSDRQIEDYSLKDNFFTVFDTDKSPEIMLDSGIIIFKRGNYTKKKRVPDSDRLFCIADEPTGNENCIVCSMSENSSITVSSVQDGNTMVSLMKEIYDVRGKLIEPCEIAVRSEENIETYPLLCFIAVLIISGKADFGVTSKPSVIRIVSESGLSVL